MLKRQGKNDILQILHAGVEPKEKLRGKLHEVFWPSFDARLCHSEWMAELKFDYMHHNPIRGKWSLVDDFTKYPYSSAGFMNQENRELQISLTIKIFPDRRVVWNEWFPSKHQSPRAARVTLMGLSCGSTR